MSDSLVPSDVVKAIQDSQVPVVIGVNGEEFVSKPLYRTPDVEWEAIQVSTLTGLVDYLRSPVDKGALDNSYSPIFVHVSSPSQVSVCTSLSGTRDRRNLLTAHYEEPNVLRRLSEGVSQQDAVIALRVGFDKGLESSSDERPDIGYDNPERKEGVNHRDDLIKYVGNITHQHTKTSTDDGISQATQVNLGLKTVEVKVPSPLVLKPYWTFPEIEQPDVEFIVRLDSDRRDNSPLIKLIPSDGGKWKQVTIQRIKKYLVDALPEFTIIA